MAINFQIENQDTYLKVVAKGIDDDLEDVNRYMNAIVEAALQYSSSKILCDERELTYSLSVPDTFQLAESAAEYAGNLAKIAIVCAGSGLKDGKFYETVARNRGLRVYVTNNFDEALQWLI